MPGGSGWGNLPRICSSTGVGPGGSCRPDGKSRVTGDCHARFCGSPGVRVPRATRLTQAEIDGEVRAGTTTEEARRIAELEREVRELRRANEILKTASAFFAQAELDRRLK